jgi:enoyl-CoA hydratase/carnithine racemase
MTMGGDVYTLTIEGPGKNSLSSTVMRDVTRRMREAGDRPVLVRGAGDAFCAGLNLKEVASLDVAGMATFLGLLDDMIDALFDHPGPMVACVNGHAIAGGCVIALCADVRVAIDDPKVRIGLNEVALGLEFPPKIMKLARYRLARHQVERALLEAGLYDPHRAVELGFIDEVAADPVTRAEAILNVLAAHPREIYAATKRTLRTGAVALDAEDRGYFRTRILPRWTSPTVKEKALAALRR